MKNLRQFAKLLLLLVLPALLAGPQARAVDTIVEGENYQLIKPAQPTSVADGKVEVVEAFWYGCPHCYHLEPLLKEWTRKLPAEVEFIHIPAQYREIWAVHAGAYYVAEALGVLEKLHQPLFDEIQKNRKNMVTHGDMARFFATHGVSEEQYTSTLNSFAVKRSLGKANSLVRGYQLSGVPALIVNGKYRVSASMNGNSNEKTLAVVDYLIAREIAALKK